MKYKLKLKEDNLPYFEKLRKAVNDTYNSDLQAYAKPLLKKADLYNSLGYSRKAMDILDKYEYSIKKFAGLGNVKLPNGQMSNSVLDRINKLKSALSLGNQNLARNISRDPEQIIGKSSNPLSLNAIPNFDNTYTPSNFNDIKANNAMRMSQYYRDIAANPKDQKFYINRISKLNDINNAERDSISLVDSEDAQQGIKIQNSIDKANSDLSMKKWQDQINAEEAKKAAEHEKLLAKQRSNEIVREKQQKDLGDKSSAKASEIKEKNLNRDSSSNNIVSNNSSSSQSSSPSDSTDWGKVAIYTIVAIIVAYIVYKIVKWLYNWYKKRKSNKTYESFYSVSSFIICEADETHQVGSIYNIMMSPIIKFFKSVFKGISAIISFIMKTIAWGASKLYKWFTSIFKSNNSTEELKDQYNNTISRINKIANTSVLKDKVSNVVKSMPKLSEYM